ncbi:GIY-YIG nuclease family protein [Endozoicomonas acroporae]|uniref:GIY-YIG nuclease family protein n=1 Tax=Endozoicomonas acroporae TaxID=1701104 RepID=UPI003D7A9615
MDLNESGYVYILSNPSMYGLLKIGYTTRTPQERVRDLNSTGVPCPFVIEYYDFFDDAYVVEGEIHTKLKKHHYGKEFFKCDLVTAIETLQGIDQSADKFYCKKEIEAAIKEKQKKERDKAERIDKYIEDYNEKERIRNLERQKEIELVKKQLQLTMEKQRKVDRVGDIITVVLGIIVLIIFLSQA